MPKPNETLSIALTNRTVLFFSNVLCNHFERHWQIAQSYWYGCQIRKQKTTICHSRGHEHNIICHFSWTTVGLWNPISHVKVLSFVCSPSTPASKACLSKANEYYLRHRVGFRALLTLASANIRWLLKPSGFLRSVDAVGTLKNSHLFRHALFYLCLSIFTLKLCWHFMSHFYMFCFFWSTSSFMMYALR